MERRMLTWSLFFQINNPKKHVRCLNFPLKRRKKETNASPRSSMSLNIQ